MLIRNRRRRLALLLAAAMLLGNRPAAQAAGENVYIYSVEDLLRVAEQCALDSWSKGRTVTLAAEILCHSPSSAVCLTARATPSPACALRKAAPLWACSVFCRRTP